MKQLYKLRFWRKATVRQRVAELVGVDQRDDRVAESEFPRELVRELDRPKRNSSEPLMLYQTFGDREARITNY